MATATAVSILVYLADIARGLGGLRSVQSELVVADPGKPQTILILGSDKRPQGQEIGARSDTTILLRVAADQITRAVDPARPEGEHPRPRDRQVQRRLLATAGRS